MKFSIYGRFQVDIRRENDTWVAYRAEMGTRTVLPDIVIPADLAMHDLATYLDDIFHEYASHGQMVEAVRERNQGDV